MASSSSEPKIDWEAFTARLPIGRDTATSLKRSAMFDKFDVNGNGFLSLAEIEHGVNETLGFDSKNAVKPVVMRAFAAARDVNAKKTGKKKDKKKATEEGKKKDAYVERDEFRLLLVYIRQYYEYYVAFNRIDTNQDSRIDIGEFRNAVDTLAKWNIKLEPKEVDATFAKLDKSGGGAILFDEFCHWAIKQKLDLDDDDDFVPEDEIGFKSSAENVGHSPDAKYKVAPMPAWRQKAAAQSAEASFLHAKIVETAVSKEEASRKRLVKLRAMAQRELTRAAALASIEQRREQKRQAVERIRWENDEAVGRNLTRKCKDIPALPEDEVLAVSKLFNAQLNDKGDSRARMFYQLFKDLDLDGSKRISFDELQRLIRVRLKLGEKQLNHEKLLGLWKVLDENLSGFVDTGELSRFMRLGAPKQLSAVQKARLRAKQEAESRKKKVKEESDKLLEKAIITQAKEVAMATEAEVANFGEMFVKQLERPGQDKMSYYALFKIMDEDESGKVQFDEFEEMCRKTLGITKEQLPRQGMLGLWRFIDENENGFIQAGEFSRFMRKAAEGPAAKSAHEASVMSLVNQKKTEKRVQAALKREETWARQTASVASASAMAMDAEAARLEALLAGVAKRGLGADSMMRSASRSSASLALKGARDELASAPAAESDSLMRIEPSPVKRLTAIKQLSREVKGPGGIRKVRVSESTSAPMLLPSISREEGNP